MKAPNTAIDNIGACTLTGLIRLLITSALLSLIVVGSAISSGPNTIYLAFGKKGVPVDAASVNSSSGTSSLPSDFKVCDNIAIFVISDKEEYKYRVMLNGCLLAERTVKGNNSAGLAYEFLANIVPCGSEKVTIEINRASVSNNRWSTFASYTMYAEPAPSNIIYMAFDEHGVPEVTNRLHTKIGYISPSLPSYITEDDTIAIFMELDSNYKYQVVTTGKRVMGQIRIKSGDAIGTLTSDAGPIEYKLLAKVGPFSSEKATIEIKRAKNDCFDDTTGKRHGKCWSVIASYTVFVKQDYDVSIRFGLGGSSLIFPKFGLSSNGVDSLPFITNSETARDIRPYVSVIFHVFNDPDLKYKFGPFLGFGLREIGSEYMVGGAWTPVLGFDVTTGLHIGKTARLSNGIKVGQQFDGKVEQLPIEKAWRTEFFVGVQVDASVAVSALGKTLGGLLGK